MRKEIPSYLLHSAPAEANTLKVRKNRFSFIDKTLKSVAETVKTMYIQSETESKNKLLYLINPLIKVFSFIFLIVVLSFANKIHSQLVASFFILIFYFISGISYKYVYKKILFLSIFFGLLIFLPASLNIVTRGNILFEIFSFEKPFRFWIYDMPQTVGVTDSGIRVVSLLFLRVLNSIALSLFFVYSSSFSQLIKGFKVFFVPDTFLMVLALTYKYIFVLSKTIEETYFALKSKLFGNIKEKKMRKIISGRIFFIFKKSKSNYENTYYAMVSRGYNGKIILCKEKDVKLIDIIYLLTTVTVGAIILFI